MKPKFETQRLILRMPKPSDWKDIYNGIKDVEIIKRVENVPYPYKKKDAEDWLKKMPSKIRSGEEYPFCIELKSEKKVIGLIGLMNINKKHETATTGSWMNKKYWRKGYMTEAKIAVNEFAFNTLKLRKLNSVVFRDNKASNATQKRLGYKLEGVKIKDRRDATGQKIHDINLYGLFKSDWKKNLHTLNTHLEKKIKKLESKK